MQKTAELSGPALDWAVAKAEGFEPRQLWIYDKPSLWKGKECRYSPSTDWLQGGAIIEREEIALCRDEGWWLADCCPQSGGDHVEVHAETPLVAAMRCYVASKLGNTVEIPEGL